MSLVGSPGTSPALVPQCGERGPVYALGVGSRLSLFLLYTAHLAKCMALNRSLEILVGCQSGKPKGLV